MMCWSRPEIYNAVGDLSRYMTAGTTHEHVKAMERVMNYCLTSQVEWKSGMQAENFRKIRFRLFQGCRDKKECEWNKYLLMWHTYNPVQHHAEYSGAISN